MTGTPLVPPSAHALAVSMSTTMRDTQTVRCAVLRMREGYCERANTLATYLDANRQVYTHRHTSPCRDAQARASS